MIDTPRGSIRMTLNAVRLKRKKRKFERKQNAHRTPCASAGTAVLR